MKYLLLGAICLCAVEIQALEYKILHENDTVNISQMKVMPDEKIGLHRDAYPRIVVAVQGGVITQLKADGSTVDVNFPTGQAVHLPIDPPDELHKSVNNTKNPIELIVIQIKK